MHGNFSNLNHLGVNKAPSKSNINYKNKRRDWTLFRDYYYQLAEHLGQQFGIFRGPAQRKSEILRLNLFVKIDLQKWIDNHVGKPPENIIQEGVLF